MVTGNVCLLEGFFQRVDTIKREMFSQKSVSRFVGDSSAFVMGAMSKSRYYKDRNVQSKKCQAIRR